MGLAWPCCGERCGCVLFVGPDFSTPLRGQLGGTSLGSCPSGLLGNLKDSDLQEKGKTAIKALAPRLIWIVQRNVLRELVSVSRLFGSGEKSESV